MAKVSKLPWIRILVEALTIFLAITLGFFAENYREEMNNRGREREMIHQLLEDLETDLTEIAPILNSNELRTNTMTWLNNNVGQASFTTDSVQAVLNPIREEPAWIYNAGMSAFSSLKSSGRLDLISNDSLRNQILYYFEDRIPPQVYRNRLSLQMERDWWERLAPYVVQKTRRALDQMPGLIVVDVDGLGSDRQLLWASAALGNIYFLQVKFFRELIELNGELAAAVNEYLAQ